MLHGLRSFILDVPDLDRAKLLYSEALGKQPYFDQPFYVGFDVGGYELGLVPKEQHGDAVAYFGVYDVDAAITHLVDRGFTVKDPPQDVGEGIITATLHDPFGHAFGLIKNLQFAPQLVTARADDISERAIVKEVVVPLPRARVWELWTTKRGLTEWLCDDARVDLRPGGAYEVYFHVDAKPGSKGGETCRVLSFLPQRMVSFTWNAPPPYPKTRFEHTWVVVELSDVDGGTHVRLTQTGWPESGLKSEPQWEQTFAYFDRAWGAVLEQLASFARTGVKP